MDTETSIKKIGNIITVIMVIKADAVFPDVTTTVATLPGGFRPAKNINYMCRGSNTQWSTDGIMYMYISVDGPIMIKQFGGTSFKYASIHCTFIS